MKHIIPLTLLILATACASSEGLTKESTRTPEGNPASSVTVIEFTDLECPACQAIQQSTVLPLLQKYGNVIRYELQHFPLRTLHAYAQESAEAAECAADQKKFWEFIGNIYASPENQSKLTREDHLERARTIGVADMDLFTRCVQSRIKRSTVNADVKDGEQRGINATPTFIIDGKQAPNNSFATVSGMVEDAIRSRRF